MDFLTFFCFMLVFSAAIQVHYNQEDVINSFPFILANDLIFVHINIYNLNLEGLSGQVIIAKRGGLFSNL